MNLGLGKLALLPFDIDTPPRTDISRDVEFRSSAYKRWQNVVNLDMLHQDAANLDMPHQDAANLDMPHQDAATLAGNVAGQTVCHPVWACHAQSPIKTSV
uniref:Uncharacterized protein n=1 Tax=Solanum lycopersicum TaxID=4081 RepID=A0A3Q7EXR6_SOLLC